MVVCNDLLNNRPGGDQLCVVLCELGAHLKIRIGGLSAGAALLVQYIDLGGGLELLWNHKFAERVCRTAQKKCHQKNQPDPVPENAKELGEIDGYFIVGRAPNAALRRIIIGCGSIACATLCISEITASICLRLLNHR